MMPDDSQKNPSVKVQNLKYLKKPSLATSIISAFWGKFMAGALLKLAHDVLMFVGPVLLEYNCFFFFQNKI